MSYASQVETTCRLLACTPGWARVAQLHGEVDDTLAAAVIGEAAKLAEAVVAPLDAVADREGCRLEAGRVRTPKGFRAAFHALGEGGWIGMDLPEALGGQGLPLALHTACQTFFDRACPAFVMAPGPSRCAAVLLAEHADAGLRDTWVPRLAGGDWAATICISEPDAGSDVGRIRTRARPAPGGGWHITGQKIWISFGDHDLTPRIGHCLLARVEGAAEGTRGLSLFLVPSTREDGSRNAVHTLRIEEKLGLHGSPTCALAFEEAEARLIGVPGRGLSQMFTMIERMRLLTANQGLGIASAAVDTARAYAAERRQGGPAEAPAVPILDHADVRRMLAGMAARTEVLRALVLELGCVLDLARMEPDAAARAEHAALAGWLLPQAKTFGAETGFDVSGAALQVLGGAGYTREWPVERGLRDSRIFAIYEGTTGMQALDLLGRRLWRDAGRGLEVLHARMAAEIAAADDAPGRAAAEILAGLVALAGEMSALRADPRAAEAGADGFLRAAWCATSAWMALRLARLEEPGARHLAALGACRLAELPAEFALAAARARAGAEIYDRVFGA
ncbi:acyl-CoA dehydrogenase [Paroceanicella profunda]|uniref:Acyl-CoA dehydrogenase n=1 Tax=Paroceanicella profunda TaxID=2579971 RepID=A0A5B8FI04_9RHOB|nr:acyl-CoA dehydrogenase family protein [Paroceanicella profunda]QDL92797.1 acyl-CoA dehydrogenase [Paroceanicella profunda]